MAIRLSKAFGSTAETWLRLQLAYDLAEARKNEGNIKVRRQHGGLRLRRSLALVLALEASGMPVEEKLRKLGIEIEPECLQALKRSGQVEQAGLRSVIQNTDSANYTQLPAFSFAAPSLLVKNQSVCAEELQAARIRRMSASGRGGLFAEGLGCSLGFDGFAHAFGVEFTAFEKIEELVCGQSIFAHGEDYLAVGGLHGETDG